MVHGEAHALPLNSPESTLLFKATKASADVFTWTYKRINTLSQEYSYEQRVWRGARVVKRVQHGKKMNLEIHFDQDCIVEAYFGAFKVFLLTKKRIDLYLK